MWKNPQKTIYTWKFDVKIDYLQSAYSLKIRPVLISSSAIAVTLQRKIRDCSHFNVKNAHMMNQRSRNSSTLPWRPHVQNLPEHTLLSYYKPTAWKRKLKHQDMANVHKRWRSAGVWREREGRYWSAVGHEGRIHCVLLLTQTIDHHKETIFTKWVSSLGAHEKSGWRVRCAPCNLQGATIAFCCEHLASYWPSPGNDPR